MRRFASMLLLGVALASLAGCRSLSAAQWRSARLDRYPPLPGFRLLRTGDRVTIHLQGPETKETLVDVIDDQGNVSLPHIRPVKIGGLTSSQAEEAVENAYVREKIYKPGTIQITILPPASEYFVEGCVFRPGEYEFTSPITVLPAIIKAGGQTQYADQKRVLLIRGGKVFTINPVKVRAGTEPDMYVEPGDVIKVPQGIL